MKKLFAKIKLFLKDLIKTVKKLRNKYWVAKNQYIKYLEKNRLNEFAIFLESQHGKEFSGNIYYILKYLALSPEYSNYTLYLSAWGESKNSAYRKALCKEGIQGVHVVTVATKEYYKAVATAKFLINDNTFLPFFQKREGQIYLNTWHGTPLKTLGKSISNEAHSIGNTQKNFLSADYILFPNEHTKDKIINDYMLENISKNHFIMGGYPRNTVFFDETRIQDIKQKYAGKTIYAYLPTFRGTPQNVGSDKNDIYLKYYLFELDKELTDNEILFVNLHPIAKKNVDFKNYRHIRPFPKAYETYEFLSIADVLITDYSSVFFDYACTRKKIVLFQYDYQEYFSDRGVYIDPMSLPFPVVSNIPDLLGELRSEKKYSDDAFFETFCKFENRYATRDICDFLILGKRRELIVRDIPNNEKENVLIYCGNLGQNGITTSLFSLLANIDRTERNYIVNFITEKTAPNRRKLLELPEGVAFYAVTGDANLTIFDRGVRRLFRRKILHAGQYMKLQRRRVSAEFKRNYGCLRLNHVIQYNGYETDVILELSTFEKNKIIYVHSDMVKEMQVRKNQRKDVLAYAYNAYDHVAVVSEDIKESTVAISGKEDNISIVRNFFDYRNVQENSNRVMTLDSNTQATVSEEELRNILNSCSKKFVTVGRFSPEKGHIKLIDAFKRFLEKDDDCYLLIIGGNSFQNYYNYTKNYISSLGLDKHVILILSISNPFAIMKKCDYFVLSSEYEGFGLVLLEAAAVGLPSVSTDITGPRGIMEEFGGCLEENSVDGLYNGLVNLAEERVKKMSIDFDKYNAIAKMRFDSLLS